jgi:type II secretory pathway pseudopilin PulG
VSGLQLDKYLVTVRRFRQSASGSRAGWLPTARSGKHTQVNAGSGPVDFGASSDARTVYEPGRVPSGDATVAPTDQNLNCDDTSTWTASSGTNENLPIHCVSWADACAL